MPISTANRRQPRMFEARLPQCSLLKRLTDVVKDIVDNGNFNCTHTGFGLQAMDLSHVCLVSMMLHADSFDHYRCDRNINFGREHEEPGQDTEVRQRQRRREHEGALLDLPCLEAVLVTGSSVGNAYRVPMQPAGATGAAALGCSVCLS